MPESARRKGLAHLVSRLLLGAEEPAPASADDSSILRVTSHVARDLLQNAAYFNSVPKAVTEYVTNAIDSAPPDTPVECEVTLARDAIRISDNASGMTYTELSNFFQMHGENAQRKRGRAVRGRFGTGKSAAFGIADTLRVETVKSGKRNVVELHRADVAAAQDGQAIPVREIVTNEATRSPRGTVITIEHLHVKYASDDAVRAYLERTLGRHLDVHHVAVNGVACRYREPAAIKTFRFKAARPVAKLIGPASCVLKISREPLGRDDNAVAVLCNGFLHATTLAGKQAEPFIEYIFGEVEVPGLDVADEPVPAFDNTRGLTLNPNHPRVQALMDWLAECLEVVRAELVARDRRRRYSKEMRLLRKVADELQGFLDDDFRVIQTTLPWASLSGPKARKRRQAAKARGQNAAPDTEKTLLDRGRDWVTRLLGQSSFQAEGAPPPVPKREPVHFELHYARLGVDASRSCYIPNRRAIYLNRDHPQLRTAEEEAGLDSLTFKLLSFDIAFTTYALAVVSQLTDQGVEIADPIDASEMMQDILDRLGRKAAEQFKPTEHTSTEVAEAEADVVDVDAEVPAGDDGLVIEHG